MAASTMVGSNILLYVNNQLYNEVQAISLNIDYGETAIYGIDSPYAQEIAPGRVTVSGSVTGLRIKNSGGLQGHNLRPLFTDIAASNYVSIRIQDRSTKEDVMYIPKAKVTKETHSAASKGSYKLNFEFIGIQPLTSVDRTDF